MGVDTCIRLPADVRVHDVAECIGILAGLTPQKTPIGQGSYACRVPGVEVKPSSIPTCCEINIRGKLIDGEGHHYVLYHFEPDGLNPGRLILPRCTAFWICIARSLVKFFGGTVDYCDCDSVDVDFKRDRPRPRNNPSDGAEWYEFQDEMLALKPITKKELAQAVKWAAYK